ncbi:MAG: hypothetical protein JSW52_12185 [Candidatus Coatesbacteria bacterium]|nr:MAG: hypothetical protein JSW52_12185 [Candidatus Coatesbacteria bacterium]
MRKALHITAFGFIILLGCAGETPPPTEEPPPEEWFKRQELAARAASVEAVLDQALVSVGREDQRALELVREARADLLSAARRTVDPELRRILIDAHRDLEPAETFLEGVNDINPPPTETDLEWLRETIVAVRVSLAPVSAGYTDELYGRYETPRRPEPPGEMGPVPAERKRRTLAPPAETPGPEIRPDVEPEGPPAEEVSSNPDTPDG